MALLQKVIRHFFDHFACGICELHATPIISAIYCWENLIQKKGLHMLSLALKKCLRRLSVRYKKAYAGSACVGMAEPAQKIFLRRLSLRKKNAYAGCACAKKLPTQAEPALKIQKFQYF